MAKRGVCKKCAVVIVCNKNATDFLNMFCPVCLTKVSRYNNLESWKLPHLFYSEYDMSEASDKGREKVKNATIRKEV